jgi:hypothetical protein
MSNSRITPFALAALVCLNVALGAALVVSVVEPQRAFAQQTAPLSGNFLVVTAEIQSGQDGVFLLDQQSRFLHIFYTQRRSSDEVQFTPAGSRNLELDFRNQE